MELGMRDYDKVDGWSAGGDIINSNNTWKKEKERLWVEGKC